MPRLVEKTVKKTVKKKSPNEKRSRTKAIRASVRKGNINKKRRERTRERIRESVKKSVSNKKFKELTRGTAYGSGSQRLKEVLTDVFKNFPGPAEMSEINKIAKEYKTLGGLANFLKNDHDGNFQRKWEIRGVRMMGLKVALEGALGINLTRRRGVDYESADDY